MNSLVARRATLIGLDPGCRWVKAVQTCRTRGGTVVTAAARFAQPHPDEGLGAESARRIMGVLSRQGFVGAAAALSVPGNRQMTAVMELPPKNSGAPIGHIACLELARAHKCGPEEIEAAWWELPAGSRSAEGTHVLIVGLKHTDADALLDASEAGGLAVRALDCAGLALARACGPLLGRDGEITAVLDLGWSAATLAVMRGPTLVYERRLEEGGLRILHAALSKQLGIDADVADYVVEHVGLLGSSASGGGAAAEQADRAGEIAGGHIMGVSRELSASLSYATRRYAGTGPSSVLVCGGGTRVPGLSDRLAATIGSPVRVVCPADVAKGEGSVAELMSDPSMMLALGLALYEGGEE